MSAVRVLGFCGLASALLTMVAAHDGRVLALSGALMVCANIYALLRGDS